MSWSRPFDDSIQLPKGKQLLTLQDAAVGRGVGRANNVRTHRRHAGVEPERRAHV
jgi:hypothetical protein